MSLSMSIKEQDADYSAEEATRRMNEALKRALKTPPKPHSEAAKKGGAAKKRTSRKK